MNLPPALLAAFPASADLLLNVARRQIDDAMLEEIAAADYGIDAAIHLARLRPIRDHGTLPATLGWHPGEVLELIRWSNPDDPAHKPGSTGRRGHQMRAFACAALLRDDFENEATLAQCLASSKVLGPEMSEAAARFLTWSIPLTQSFDRWLSALGLLVVATRFRGDRISDRGLGDAAAWVLAEETEARRAFGLFNPSDPPPAPFGISSGFWKPLATELIHNAVAIQANDVRNDLEMIGSLILDF